MLIKKIVILFSGEGTNLENVIKKMHNKIFGNYKIEVIGAITDSPTANGIQKSRALGVKTVILDSSRFINRVEFDKEVLRQIKRFNPDLTVLAGFMKILSTIFTKNIKAINIHPSLLPKFKGLNAIERSYKSTNDLYAGVSVHVVSDDVDSGEIILQDSFKKTKDMSFENFYKNIKKIEFDILPKAILKSIFMQDS